MITKPTMESDDYCRTYRTATNIREVGGLVLSESSYRPGITIPFHAHDDHAYFNLVLRGGYTERSKNDLELGPATLIFHPAGAAHSDRFHREQTRLFNVRLSVGWLDQIRDHATILNRSAVFHKGSQVGLAIKLYREFARTDPVSSLMIEGLALEMLAESWRSSSDVFRAGPRWLARASEMIHDQFNQNLRLADIARSVGVHPVHFSRVFRQHFGCTVGEYVQELRIELACRRLSDSATASATLLAELAFECGFYDQSHFSRAFRKVMGMTPTQYRAVFSFAVAKSIPRASLVQYKTTSEPLL